VFSNIEKSIIFQKVENIRIIKQITIPSATITLRDDDIIRFDLPEGRSISVQDVKDMTDVAGEWGQGKKFRNLIIMPEFDNIPFEVRQYTAGVERSRYSIADAFVISSIAMQIIGNFYLQFHKPVLPTRIFNNEAAAINWLAQQRERDVA
jgi:hypothetical protein